MPAANVRHKRVVRDRAIGQPLLAKRVCDRGGRLFAVEPGIHAHVDAPRCEFSPFGQIVP